jgi:osmoprotectant transport system ATP-binding protein
MILLEDATKVYVSGQAPAVDGVSLHVREGTTVALLGGSGCGKTTTLKMINRLVEPTSGRIRVGGEDTAGVDPVSLRRRIGYVFQGIGLFPHMSVGQNVAAVPKLLGWDRARTASRVDELLELVGLEPGQYRERMPSELSGGQRQRVGVARALAAEPRVMLMDEPFGALDPITRDTLHVELKSIRGRLGLTVVLVTHDMTEALLLADEIAVMREGKVVQLATPHELMTSPADEYVKQLVATPKRQADELEAIAAGGGGAAGPGGGEGGGAVAGQGGAGAEGGGR